MCLKPFQVNAKVLKITFAPVLFNLQSTGSLAGDLEDTYKKCLRMTVLFTRCIKTWGTNI